MPTLLAACVVSALRFDDGMYGVTGIDKRPVAGPVKVTRYGLRGDVQADRKNHGGLDKALYAYSIEDARHWQNELGRDLGPGWFGENLLLDGIDTNNALIGERWQIGEQVVVEVTMPRTPCMTFARWVGGDDERGWVKRFSVERRLGAYLRVLRTGSIQAGDEVCIIHRPDTADTIVSVYSDPL